MNVRITKLVVVGKKHNYEYYIAEYRKHWWNFWRWMKDVKTDCPKMFRSIGDIEENVKELKS